MCLALAVKEEMEENELWRDDAVIFRTFFGSLKHRLDVIDVTMKRSVCLYVKCVFCVFIVSLYCK